MLWGSGLGDVKNVEGLKETVMTMFVDEFLGEALLEEDPESPFVRKW